MNILKHQILGGIRVTAHFVDRPKRIPNDFAQWDLPLIKNRTVGRCRDCPVVRSDSFKRMRIVTRLMAELQS